MSSDASAGHRVRFAEDYEVGQVFDLGWREVSAEEIMRFAREYDPHPFHTDEQAARQSMYGGLTASGWQTALFMMQLMHGGFVSVETSLGSPGHDELRWLRPVRPGDRLHGQVKVLGVKLSRSRPDIGFVANEATLTNQHGEQVYLLRSSAIFRTRAASSTDKE